MADAKTETSTSTLAIHGGPCSLPEGPPVWPKPDPEVQQALQQVWEDGSWGKYHGNCVDRLVTALGAMHQRQWVLPCCSGTYAVEAALRGLGIEQGDEVILAGYDFPGNFRAIEQVGGRPVLVDIAEDSWSLDDKRLDEAAGPATRAVIVSHLHGTLARIESIVDWARSRKVAVIEDACQVPGAKLGEQLAGSYGDVSVLSFGGSKLLSAGRGGALLTSRDDVYQRAKIFGNRGNDAFPLSQLQAAVLLPQLEMLESRNLQRQRGAERLLQQAGGWVGLISPQRPAAVVRPSYYKLAWRYTGAERGGPPREVFLAALQAEGVGIDAGFRGFVGRSVRRCRRAGSLSHSESAAKNAVLLHHPVLLEQTATLDRVVAAFEKVQAQLLA
jgi:dTDP-4-amino-4,6-dideoxygalactose transaminase